MSLVSYILDLSSFSLFNADEVEQLLLDNEELIQDGQSFALLTVALPQIWWGVIYDSNPFSEDVTLEWMFPVMLYTLILF